MDIDDIEKIVRILRDNDITEFEFAQGDVKVRMSRGTASVGATGAVSPDVVTALQSALARGGEGAVGRGAGASPETPSEEYVRVESPIVGTFYRRPSPEKDPFKKEGDSVRKGEVLCIIEAMKLMNEIESPCSGTVVKIFPNDGEVVEFGELLFHIAPDA